MRSEISQHLDYFIPQLTVATLVSAWDLRRGLLAVADALRDGWATSPLAEPEVVIVDSGGYETASGADEGELVRDLRCAGSWTPADWQETLDLFGVPADNVVGVSFDRPGDPYREQIEQAQRELASRPHLAPLMLLKPEVKHSVHELPKLEAVADRLSFFAAVGVTEHELGGSLVARLQAVMALREMIERHRPGLPIHIFGALDPLFVPLYFAAGADIFDGLTWLRYGFDHGVALHRESAALLAGHLTEREDVRSRAVLTANVGELARLTHRLQRFAVERRDWAVFNHPDIQSRSRTLGTMLEDVFLSAKAGRH